MVSIKPGVTFVYHPAGFRILEAAKCVSKAIGRDFLITSGSDGASDPHHVGRAYDFRLKTFEDDAKATIIAGFQAELGPQFFVYHEAIGTPNEHLHVQPIKGLTYGIDEYLRA